MKFGIIKERKNPPDRRVVFSPTKLVEVKQRFPLADFSVETSDIRVFNDDEYQQLGFQVSENLTSCDVLLGVKEVPVDALLPNKNTLMLNQLLMLAILSFSIQQILENLINLL